MAAIRSTTQKGKPKLHLSGYSYNFHRNLASGEESWECDKRRSVKCRGRLITFGERTLVTQEHCHPPDPISCKVKDVKAEIRDAAVTTRENPASIVRAATAGIADPVAAKLPSRNTLSKTVRNARIGLDGFCSPANLEEFWVPEEYQRSISGSEFLKWDSWPEDDRILIFASDKGLELLSESKMWHLDGTFKSSPLLFYQLYTVHGYIRNKSFPFVYCLLPNKSQLTYAKMFGKLKQLRQGLDPDIIMIDYEKAAANAIGRAFPRAEIRGCAFHFQQCIWRRIQSCPEILRQYKDDVIYCTEIKKLAALAFRKVEDVRPSYLALIETDFFRRPEIRELLNYFEVTWIGKPPRANGNVWTDPLFLLPMWNVFDAVGNSFARTNNSVEGWHFRFQSLLGCQHPNIFKFINDLRLEEDSVRVEAARLEAGGRVSPRKIKYREIDDKLKTLNEFYEDLTALGHLRRVAQVITMG